MASILRRSLTSIKMDPAMLIRRAPRRLLRAAPAVIMGIMLNTLDAASTGLLIFPATHGYSIFDNLHVQAMSMYIMTTIICQLTLCLGGSLFRGAMGSMLVEVLPFLRSIATNIAERMGYDHPDLLPTVFATYALTSCFIGAGLLALGIFRLGWIVEYFPGTVLTGTIGAIGLFLFLLALQLLLPQNAPPLTWHTAGELLFSSQHVPLLLASFIPAAFLTLSMRWPWLSRKSRGFVNKPVYVPMFLLVTAAVFWIVIGILGNTDGASRRRLADQGWLFTQVPYSGSGLGSQWNYWAFFDFNRVHWSAMTAAVQNMVLLVIIGVLRLTIYVPAMALMLDIPRYNMNWELIGHGISNILAGVAGTVPNLIVLSNTRLFVNAGGGRFEAFMVTGFTMVLFFTSGRLVNYVPTVLGSIVVQFLGFELMIEALWCSAADLIWCEWIVVLGTLLSCTFAGFLPGFGIGIGLAVVVHVLFSLVDSRAIYTDLRQLHKSRTEELLKIAGCSQSAFYGDVSSLKKDKEQSSMTVVQIKRMQTDVSGTTSCTGEQEVELPSSVLISLKGNIFFASLPPLELQIDRAASSRLTSNIVVDLSKVHRAETCLGLLLKRKARELATRVVDPIYLIVAGVGKGSGVAVDLSRGGAKLFWTANSSEACPIDAMFAYISLQQALFKCQGYLESVQETEEDAMLELSHVLGSPQVPGSTEQLSSDLRINGGKIERRNKGDIIFRPGDRVDCTTLVIRGKINVYDRGDAQHKVELISQCTSRRRLPMMKAIITTYKCVSSRLLKIAGRRVTTEKTDVDVENSASLLTGYLDEKLLEAGDSFGFVESICGGREIIDETAIVVEDPCILLIVPGSGSQWVATLLNTLQQRRSLDHKMMRQLQRKVTYAPCDCPL